ncbi:MAG: hypothetical protein K0Q73_8969 [Paenibacillus sp.]|nr:hypothetical protein [Paenibacillus sp.]
MVVVLNLARHTTKKALHIKDFRVKSDVPTDDKVVIFPIILTAVAPKISSLVDREQGYGSGRNGSLIAELERKVKQIQQHLFSATRMLALTILNLLNYHEYGSDAVVGYNE